LELRIITREVIKLLEDKSGIPVRVLQEPKLTTIAAVRIAREGSVPAHFVLYKPSAGESPDYAICFGCGYILRLFSTPPEQRFDIAESIQGQEEVEKEISTPGGIATKYQLKRAQIEEFRTQFLSGIITHLQSVPVGLRVSEWLSSSYPELNELQETHVKKELYINRESLKAEVQEITPPRVFQAAQAISAAYALYWSDKYSKPDIFNPYRLYGFEKDGETLIDIYKSTPDDPSYDKTLIEAWAKYLSITDWYNWVPYQPPE